MKIQNFIIPPESKYVSVTTERDRLVLIFEPENPRTFFCQETDHLEETPNIGHLAILWNANYRESIVSYVADTDFKDGSYQAKNGEWYDNAIRFRSVEQYMKILKFNVEEIKE